VRILERGYDEVEAAKVFPLLPMIGWAVEKATGLHHLFAFIAVSNLASLASFYVLYRIFRDLEGEVAARWGLTAFAAYPFAYYQAAAYPESLMILASALALWLAMRGHHLWAGLALGVGLLARHLTLFGGAGMLAAQIRQRGWHPRRLLLHPGILGLLIP
jgi:Gpi18-like mannosyltransferase